MKFLLCHDYYSQPGGESDVFDSQVSGLRKMGNEVVLFVRRNADIERFSVAEKLQLASSSYFSMRTYRELLAVVQEEKPDAAIIQNVYPLLSPSVYAALHNAGVPSIQAVYNYRFVCPSAELYTQGAICERCVTGNTLHAIVHRCYHGSYSQSAWYATLIGIHRAVGTFANSIDSFMVPDFFLGGKLAEGGIPKEKIWRNPNPFFVDNFRGVSDHKGYVLFVGRLVPQKGILTLLRSMRQTKSSSRLEIVGLGELERRVKEEVSEAGLGGRVSWQGARWGDELTELIEGCAAIIIPSEWYDNLPVILCRANAMGKPVVASRIDGIPEYVTDGVNGFLFETGNVEELAGLIDRTLELTNLEYRELSERSRNFAEEVLDYPNHYARLIEEIGKMKTDGLRGDE